MMRLCREGFLEEVAWMDGENLNSYRQAAGGDSGRGNSLGKAACQPPSTAGPSAQAQVVGNEEQRTAGAHHGGPGGSWAGTRVGQGA